MTNTVIVNRRGIQMRQSNGRYAPKIVPPAVAASVGPATPRKTPGTSGVVPVEKLEPRRNGPGVFQAPQAGPTGPGYRVFK
jgi:hypothetical protein